MTDVDVSSVALRRATPDDAAGVADVYLNSFRDTYSFPLAHTDDDVRGWVRDEVIPTKETWVAVAGNGQLIGMMALEGAQLDQLYVLPGWIGRGIGTRFLELAKRLRPEGLSLYTFQVNERARDFYERHGFVLLDENDGARNEEHQPDVRYAWLGSASEL